MVMATIEALAFSPALSERTLLLPSSSSRFLHRSSSLSSSFFSTTSPLLKSISSSRLLRPFPASFIRSAIGENPDWLQDDYIALGLAHCFRQDDSGKLQDVYLIEPIAAGSLECMDNGGATCYHHVTGSTLGVAVKVDSSLLPPEFSSGSFCSEFDYRLKCAARTWKRPHAVDNLMKLVPVGALRSDFNFSLVDKRVINQENIVSDSDNIKQDMSIDVYGRNKEEATDDTEAQIASLYNS